MKTIELSKKEVTNLLATNLDELVKYGLLTKNEYRMFSGMLNFFEPGSQDQKTVPVKNTQNDQPGKKLQGQKPEKRTIKKRIFESVYSPLLCIPFGALYFLGMYFIC